MPSTSGGSSSSSISTLVSDIMSNEITTSELQHHIVDDAAVEQAVEEVAAVAHQQDVIRVAHAMNHDISHGEAVSICFLILFYIYLFGRLTYTK